MKEKIYFDMDGTIVDLYGQDNWLEDLMTEKVGLYVNAKPLIDLNLLRDKIERLQSKGFEINIITWLAKNVSNNYNTIVTEEKLEWLDKTGIKFDNVYIVQYGTNKHDVPTSLQDCYLLDDNPEVRKDWYINGGIAFDETRIFETLNYFIEN